MDTTNAPRQYGWKAPERPPHPKLLFKARHKVRANNPAKVDLRSKDSPVENQGQLGSCTGFGWAGALQFKERNAPVLVPKLSFWKRVFVALGLMAAPAPPPVSDFNGAELFIYYNERAAEGNVGSDSGASVASGAKVLATLGCPPESAWPYDIRKFAVKPPQSAYDLAKNHTIAAPAALDVTELDELRTALSAGHPVVFGFYVYTSFESLSRDSPVYVPRGRFQGGHCVMAVGYDDAAQVVIVRNSWGKEWGLDGYFYMPYSVFTNPRITSDAWALTG